MVAKIIDGKKIAANIRKEIAREIIARKKQGLREPGLAVILVGNDEASAIYVQNKENACKEVGIRSSHHHLSKSIREEELISLITQLNQDPSIDGILIQLPLPESIDSDRIITVLDPKKDVDGFHPYNVGLLAQRRPLLRPCTPFGIMTLLDGLSLNYKDSHAVIVGASNIVGRPMAFELLLVGGTVTICHRFTKDLMHHVKEADILISAAGKPQLIKGEWIKKGATVIDVGITRLANGKITGDVEFEKACEKAAWITPVPGGVGPMTVVSLLKNTLIAANTN